MLFILERSILKFDLRSRQVTRVGKSQSDGASLTLNLSSDIFRTVIGSEDRLKVYLDIRYLDISYLQNCDRL